MRLEGVAESAVVAVVRRRRWHPSSSPTSRPTGPRPDRVEVAPPTRRTHVPSDDGAERFVRVGPAPRTVRHKVDRTALPPPPPIVTPAVSPASGNVFEAGLADLFGEILGVEAVGLDDDFFELGR